MPAFAQTRVELENMRKCRELSRRAAARASMLPGFDPQARENRGGLIELSRQCLLLNEKEGGLYLVEALLKVDWPHCAVVICDDSTLPHFTARVDAFARVKSAIYGSRLRVIRRQGQDGWKAGNINHALRQLECDFDYFAICDCDGIFPSGLVRECLAYFPEPDDAQSRLAFVQARQEGNPAQTEPFGRAMSLAVGAHFRHCVAARQRYGFVMFYGHGALISMDAWRAIGGFPEIVTEDLAFTLKVRARGWRGVYAHEIVCMDDFPPTYGHLRKRTEKWIRGTAECLRLHFGEFLRAKAVPWWEKLDVLVHGTTHFMALPMLAFLLLLATVLPASIAEFRVPGGFFLPAVPDGKSLVERAMGLRYHVFWSWDFYAVMLLTMAGTWLPLLAEPRHESRASTAAKVRYLAVSTFVYLAGLLAEVTAILAFVITGRAYFRATYDAGADHTHACEKGSGRSKVWIAASHPNHWWVFGADTLLGAGFAAALIEWRNLWFAGPAIALMLSPIVRSAGFQNRLVRILVALPFLLMLSLFVLIGWQLLHAR